ncbi:MAG: PEP-CTERM sorting domain-containing protein [Oscillatoriales cyanobacterium C42_A2020_001]|nr:PEP-CTERM sorting domain-containing protein [Leptolyngbyaceae cyanobacterium C42_A2020_001]
MLRSILRSTAFFIAPVASAASLAFVPAIAEAASLTTFRLQDATIADINLAIDSGALTSQQLVQLYLNRIAAYDKQGPSINSLITINPNALQEAALFDQQRNLVSDRGPLYGIPVIVKDNFNTFDLPTTAGVLAFDGFVPAADAFQVQKLREAGAIILGKANLSEFAFSGSTSISSLGGTTLNPYDPLRSPAGSSGGTGASIAASFATVGLGTDTGGSIRNPSAFNSLVGVRPTIGLSSRSGIVPLALSQDTGGPLARSVLDAALTLDATVGFDPNDPITATGIGNIPDSYTDFLQVNGLQGKRIGIVRDLFGSDADPEYAQVNAVINQAIATLESLGATIVESVTIPGLSEILASPSLSAFEFRYDLEDYLAAEPNAPYNTLQQIIDSGLFLPSNLSTLIARNNVPPLETNQAYQDIIQNRPGVTQGNLLTALTGLDALLYPTSQAPPRLNSQAQRIGSNNRLSAFSGFPAITLPAGYTADGLPVGMEFLGRAFDEPTLLQLAYAFEQGTKLRQTPGFTPDLPGEVFQYEAVPEPTTLAGLALAGLGMTVLRRRKVDQN